MNRTARYVLPALCAAMGLCGPALSEEEPASQPDEAPEARIAINPLAVDPAEYLDRIELPPGFRIEIFASGVGGARSLALSPSGTVFVGTRTDPKRNKIGKLYAVTNPERDHRGNEVITLAEGLNVPNGVAFRDGALYVAEVHRVTRWDGIETRLDNPPEPVVLGDSFPDEFHHGWKYLRFGPDERLYVPVGAPCNVCEVENEQGTIVSMRADGGDRRIHARGVRNSVGFDFHPQTGSSGLPTTAGISGGMTDRQRN